LPTPLFITTAVMVLYVLNLQFTVNMVFLSSSCSWHVLYSRKFSVDAHDLRSFDTSPTLGCPPVYILLLSRLCITTQMTECYLVRRELPLSCWLAIT
jgi:hypothetical protein